MAWHYGYLTETNTTYVLIKPQRSQHNQIESAKIQDNASYAAFSKKNSLVFTNLIRHEIRYSEEIQIKGISGIE